MPWRLNEKPSGTERAVSALCYLTAGLAGIIYIIVSRSSYEHPFFRFHFLQSIVIYILGMLLGWAFKVLMDIVGGFLPLSIAVYVVEGVSIISKTYGLMAVYGLIFAALGKYAEIPFLSNIVRQNMR